MADGVTIDPGTTPTIKFATDDLGATGHAQYVKLLDATDNSTTATGVAGNPLRVDPTGTTAQPVTDNGGTLSIDDGGGSVTVDGAVAVSAVSGVVNIIPASPAAGTYLTVRLTDGSSWYTATGGGGGGGTSMTDDAAYAVGSATFTPAGGTYRSSRDSVDDNDGGAFAMTQKRAILSAIETPNGDSAMDDSLDAVKVSVVAGSAGIETQYTEGDVDSTITGTAILFESTSDTLRAVSATYPLPVTVTSGGTTLTNYTYVSAASTNATSVKASSAQLHSYELFNNGTLPRYVKFFNLAVAPTVGTSTPVFQVMVPAGAGANLSYNTYRTFATGLSFAITAGIALLDNTVVASSEVSVNLTYL